MVRGMNLLCKAAWDIQNEHYFTTVLQNSWKIFCKTKGQQHKTKKHDKANCGNPSARKNQHCGTHWNLKGRMCVAHYCEQMCCWKRARKSREAEPPAGKKPQTQTFGNVMMMSTMSTSSIHSHTDFGVLKFIKGNLRRQTSENMEK